LFAAALLAAAGLTSAADAQSPDYPVSSRGYDFPQTAPPPPPAKTLPVRGNAVPLLLEQEQVGEHGDMPQAKPTLPALPPLGPSMIRGKGLPECDEDDGKMCPAEVAIRCLLFTLNPLAAFLPIEAPVPCEAAIRSFQSERDENLPAPQYVQHPPQCIPPSPACPLPHEETVPDSPYPTLKLERLEVMPNEVEPLYVMPDQVEIAPKYQFLGLWHDFTDHFTSPVCPLAEVRFGVAENDTGSFTFGIGVELSRTGAVVVKTEPAATEPIPTLPKDAEANSGGSCRLAPASLTKHAGAIPQVQLNVLIAEVDRQAARKLSLDRAGEKKAPRWCLEVAHKDRQQALQTGVADSRENGHAKVLTQPCLLTLSGQKASFLTGGERAIPVPGPGGEADVQFDQFGTRVTCLPVVLPNGTIRLDVEPEISELCEVKNDSDQGIIYPGCSSQCVRATANIEPGQALVICGPKNGGASRLLLIVTPTVVEPPAATGTEPVLFPVIFSTFGDALRECLDHFFGCRDDDAQRRERVLMNQSENLRQIEYEMEHFWMVDQPSRLSPLRVNPATLDEQETVHDLLVKCQRELSRGHYAGAQDLAQQALERNPQQVAADPLVTEDHLLQRVKEVASLPLGNVDPCEARATGSCTVPPGEAKPIGSRERMVEALLQAFNLFYKEGRYHEAEALANRAVAIDPENASAVAALSTAQAHCRPAKREKERQIERKLDVAVSLNFKDKALGAVLDELSTMQEINILPDMPALEEKGISFTQPVTLRIENMSLKTALKILLKSYHLTYVVEDEAVKITTPEKARGKPVLCTYSIGDLLPEDVKSNPEAPLVTLIQSTIVPSTWASQGGPGTIDYFSKSQSLVVNQTVDVQEQVADLLAALRRLSGDSELGRKRFDAMGRFQADFEAGRYEEAKVDALQALTVAPGDPLAAAAFVKACGALARQPRPETVPQCTYTGGLRPILPSADPTVVNALQKILIDVEKGGPAGGVEEAEPKEEQNRPAPRR
jgi:tetratricopeptide (TPR) repeat protein